MTDIIDINAERDKRDRPDGQFVTQDMHGRDMFAFTLSFEHRGRSWSVQIFAYDWADAEARVQSMRKTIYVQGQLYSEIPG